MVRFLMDPNGPLYGPQFVRKSKLMDPLWTPLIRLISKHLCLDEGLMDPFYTPPPFPPDRLKTCLCWLSPTPAYGCPLLPTPAHRTISDLEGDLDRKMSYIQNQRQGYKGS